MSDKPSYEEAREQLQEIVRRLESGQASLSESMALWEKGEQLADVCSEWLDGARTRVEARTSPARYAQTDDTAAPH